MLRRVLFVSTLILAGAFGFANSAKAVSQPVTLTGTVPTSCTITDVVPGILVPNGDNSTLSSTLSGGSPATLNINCTSGNVSLTAPAKTAGTGNTADDDIEVKTATLKLFDDTSVVSGGTPIPVVPGAATVDLTAQDTTAPLVAGTYTFTTTVTVTP